MMNTMSIKRLGYEKIPPPPVKDMIKSARNSKSTSPATTSPDKHNSLGIKYLVALRGSLLYEATIKLLTMKNIPSIETG
jgi:hypothetical protein